uniref:GIY-YIG endonuclease n=1 Tax=Ceratocystis albifundus TaxID=357446 RepID=A0A5P9W7Q4_9PEZI|nr:hypothetical protein [Ceratocystis albifundus]QFX74853.1 hypothetical protein [Ceratocystis albifundus]
MLLLLFLFLQGQFELVSVSQFLIYLGVDYVIYHNISNNSILKDILFVCLFNLIFNSRINTLINMHTQNQIRLPLFLTSKGVKASHDLISMINLLPDKNSSSFRGDNLLYMFLINNCEKLFRFNMELSLKTIKPNKMYNIPLKYQKVLDGDCSGIYCFVHKETGNFGIGSAISCRDRLYDHMNSFYGHRLKSRLHEWVLANGGISSVKWAPIITYDNIVQEWYNQNYAFSLSKGGAKILQGFGQYVSRILEQSLYINYKPYLNINNDKLKDIIFFNFSWDASEMLQDLDETHIYQAWLDKEDKTLLAEANSFNSLADLLGISIGTVRNNMNWSKGLEVTDDKGKTIAIYLKEKGESWRIEQLNSQLKPKDKYPLIELKSKSLYDLIPGKIYAIYIETLEIKGIYDNQRELWNNLNPNDSEWKNYPLSKQRNFLDNRIGRYFNLIKPGGISTELGVFYFCKHPDYLPGKTIKASGLFAVDTLTGLTRYYANNSQAGDRGTVRRNRNNNTITKNGIKYINEDVFIKHFPAAEAKVGAELKLNRGTVH